MTDTNEVEFNFQIVKSAEKETSPRRQQQLDAQYIKNRAGMLAKSKEKTKAARPEERMKNNWQHNFEALPEADQVRIDEANLDCRVMQQMAIDVIAGKNTIPADEIYRIVAGFVAATGKGDSFSDLGLLAVLDAGTFDDATSDDLNIRNFGRPTKLNGLIFDVFCSAVWSWAKENRDTCNPAIFAELVARFATPEPSPIPAQPIGYRNSTRSEEAAREITQEFVKTQQRIMAGV